MLGILVMNIQSFAMVGAAYMNPTVLGPLTGGDYWVWFLSHVLADQKFMTIFSLLFGAGIVMIAQRQEAKGRSPASLHYRRMGWLLVIGLLHAHLLWFGDILVTYALCGALGFVFRKWRPWLLMIVGTLLIGVASAFSLLTGLSMPVWPEETVRQFEEEQWSPPAEKLDEEIAIYRGSWLGQMPHRAETAFFLETFVFLILFLWRAGGLMLIGMALFRWDVLTGRRSVAFYARLIALGGIAGVPLVFYGIGRNFAAGWSVKFSMFLGNQYNYWGSLLIAVGYVGLVMISCKNRRLTSVLRPLAGVGQMALTNYLLQTIICTTIFYGHGLGQFARFTRVEQVLTVVAVSALQLIACPIWLRYFRFGPFEWLWRSLTYWRLQPMKRGPAEMAME